MKFSSGLRGEGERGYAAVTTAKLFVKVWYWENFSDTLVLLFAA
jgi:hypothetical protein